MGAYPCLSERFIQVCDIRVVVKIGPVVFIYPLGTIVLPHVCAIVFETLGFIFAEEKSQVVPNQKGRYIHLNEPNKLNSVFINIMVELAYKYVQPSSFRNHPLRNHRNQPSVGNRLLKLISVLSLCT